MLYMVGTLLKGNIGMAMLSNEFLQSEIALPFPFMSVDDVLLAFDLSNEFVFSCILASERDPSPSTILPPVEWFH
jgi:hypothetical protein